MKDQSPSLYSVDLYYIDLYKHIENTAGAGINKIITKNHHNMSYIMKKKSWMKIVLYMNWLINSHNYLVLRINWFKIYKIIL